MKEEGLHPTLPGIILLQDKTRILHPPRERASLGRQSGWRRNTSEVCPYSPGCLCISHVDVVRLDRDCPAESTTSKSSSPIQAEQGQAESPLSSPCEVSGVPDAPARQGLAGSQHICCTQCHCSPHQDHSMGIWPQGGCQQLLLWKAHEALP